MPEDYIPESVKNRHDFLKKLSDDIDDHAAELGWDSGRVSNLRAFLAPLIARYADVMVKQDALDTASGGAADAFRLAEPELRRRIGELKKTPGYHPGIGAALDIVSDTSKPDPATIKPSVRNGYIRLTGRKNYAETVNIYMRRKGETVWRLVVAKRKTFPFDDQTPLAAPGVPEEREYRAIGVIGDDEVGMPSDAVSVIYGG